MADCLDYAIESSAQSARLSVWKKTHMQIFFACIVTQTLLGITPGLISCQAYQKYQGADEA